MTRAWYVIIEIAGNMWQARYPIFSPAEAEASLERCQRQLLNGYWTAHNIPRDMFEYFEDPSTEESYDFLFSK